MKGVLGGLVAGVASGVLLLGIGGRLAMRLLALIAHRPTHLGLGGTLGILLIGAILGAIASLGYTLFFRHVRLAPAIKGACYGTVLFTVLVPLQPAAIREEIAAFQNHLMVAGLFFWAVCAGYGVLLARLVAARSGVHQTAPPVAA
jgi:hypothetical protein